VKVLLIVSTASVVGGVETWLDRLVAHLELAGEEVVVGLAQGLHFNNPERFLAAHPFRRAVTIDGRGLNREGRVRAIVRAVEGVKPDIVIPLGVVDAFEAVVRCKSKGQMVRLVVHAQGNLPPMLADLADYKDWIDRVVCPGVLTSRVLVGELGFLVNRVCVVPNGADVPTHGWRERPTGTPLRIGYIGRFTRGDKRCLDIVGLAKALDDIGMPYELVLTGDGPCRQELHNGLASAQGRVSFLGAMKHDALYADVFPNLDALILTSASEAFGIVLVEAMAHGVVPVVSRYAGFRAEGLITEGVTGLAFPIGEMRDAAQLLQSLSDDDAMRRQLAAAGVARSQQYTWGRSLREWHVALLTVCANEPAIGAEVPVPPAPSSSGLMDRLKLPEALKDSIRRMRRTVAGSVAKSGGEEWPLFRRHHDDAVLARISAALQSFDVPQSDWNQSAERSGSVAESAQ